MTIEAIGFIPPSSETLLATAGTASAPAGEGFGVWLERELAQVNDQLKIADAQVQRLATGEVENLHQVMMSLQKARISFELIVQVRNKLLDAYQDVMRMSI